jgi:hypothetical protein
MMKRRKPKSRHVICVKNAGYRVSLELHKIYRALPDAKAARRGWMRVIDESEEDYLFPEDYFLPIRLPRAVQQALWKDR